jgi:hypothetical protein
MCNGIDWATLYNNSTFIEFDRVWITNSLLRCERERVQHESEVTQNRYSILREGSKWPAKFNVPGCLQNWGESMTLAINESFYDRFTGFCKCQGNDFLQFFLINRQSRVLWQLYVGSALMTNHHLWRFSDLRQKLALPHKIEQRSTQERTEREGSAI